MTDWETLKVGDIVTCSSHEGYHQIVRFHRAKRFGPMTLVEFKTWNPETCSFSRFEKNSSLSNLSPVSEEVEKLIKDSQES